MALQRHEQREPQQDITEPARSPEPVSAEEAAQVIRNEFGEAVEWERTFHNAKDHEGNPFYVDLSTGQAYDTIPTLHHKDGKPT